MKENLNYLQPLKKIQQDTKKPIDELFETMERKVTQHMNRDKYQNSQIFPPKKYYENVINIMKRAYQVKK